MTKDKIFSIIRTILMAFGGFLIGQNLFGNVIDGNIFQEIVGSCLALIAMIWSFVDKTSTIEAFQSTIMNVFKFIGGLLVASGKVTTEIINGLSGLLIIIAPMIYQWLSKKKTTGLANGTIELTQLKGGGLPKK